MNSETSVIASAGASFRDTSIWTDLFGSRSISLSLSSTFPETMQKRSETTMTTPSSTSTAVSAASSVVAEVEKMSTTTKVGIGTYCSLSNVQYDSADSLSWCCVWFFLAVGVCVGLAVVIAISVFLCKRSKTKNKQVAVEAGEGNYDYEQGGRKPVINWEVSRSFDRSSLTLIHETYCMSLNDPGVDSLISDQTLFGMDLHSDLTVFAHFFQQASRSPHVMYRQKQ